MKRADGGTGLDGVMRWVVDTPLNEGGRWFASRGASAKTVTLAGLALGLAAAGPVGLGWSGVMVAALLLAGHVAGGLDEAVARARGKTDFGGYLDIVCHFAF